MGTGAKTGRAPHTAARGGGMGGTKKSMAHSVGGTNDMGPRNTREMIAFKPKPIIRTHPGLRVRARRPDDRWGWPVEHGRLHRGGRDRGPAARHDKRFAGRGGRCRRQRGTCRHPCERRLEDRGGLVERHQSQHTVSSHRSHRAQPAHRHSPQIHSTPSQHTDSQHTVTAPT